MSDITTQIVQEYINMLDSSCRGELSDGWHTFDDLYNHRYMLFLTLIALKPELSWASKTHFDGTKFDGYFLACVTLPTGEIRYHLPLYLWHYLPKRIKILDRGLEWDGESSTITAIRLFEFIRFLEND